MSDTEDNKVDDNLNESKQRIESATSFSTQVSGIQSTDNESIRNSHRESNKQDAKGKKGGKPKLLQNYRFESGISRTSTETEKHSAKAAKVETTEIEIQTEWSWLKDMLLLEKIRKCEILIDESEEASRADEETYFTEESLVIEQPDQSLGEELAETPLLESIGPPKILQYVPETRKVDFTPPEAGEENDEVREIDTYMKGYNVHIKGNNLCEFCGRVTLPWPTIQAQETKIPNELYCCTDYREYVEALIELQQSKTNEQPKLINVAPHPKTKNKKEKRLAKLRAEQKEKEKQIAKEKKREELLKEQERERAQQTQSRSTVDHGIDMLTDRTHSTTDYYKSRRSSVTNATAGKRGSRAKIKAERLARLSIKTANTTTTTTRSISSAEEEVVHIQESTTQFTRQIRSINYQLSNLKYLTDGWTVRQPSPLEFDNVSDSEEEADILVPAVIPSAAIKMQEKPLFTRNYKNGNLCLIFFPDSTGNVYYESGRIAMTVSLVARGMHVYTILADNLAQDVLAVFDPYGNVCCNFRSGKLRLQIGPLGGAEFEHDEINEVHRRKRWLWWDATQHIHAPPFQPIHFTLNDHFGVKIHNQQKMYLTFIAEGHQYNFRVGAKLEISKPAAIPSGFKLDPDMQFLKRSRKKVEQLIKSINSHLTKTTIEAKLSIKLPKIMSDAESLFSERGKVINRQMSKTPASKLLNMEASARSKMLASRGINDKLTSKSSSRFLVVP